MADERILVVAAHGDDEVLGAGGTLAWHSRSGDAVRMCILSDSEATAPGLEIRRRESPSRLAPTASRRRACTEEAAAVLGAESWAMYSFPDNAFDLRSSRQAGIVAAIRDGGRKPVAGAIVLAT